ncbi:MAG: 4-hydroxy-3-methylbut-2-enyl diphosphate reductase [Sphingobacteriales bacterium 12-47-4]|nr:MAG: 4-hydroxy-3-methylbut-2-enyl diphosphate reductase [Sphingobacteriales bacterium 12-47-4]
MKSFEIPEMYRSPLITAVKQKRKEEDKLKKDFSPTLLDFGTLRIHLARHFGFCYGVENAIEIAFRTIAENPDKRIFLLSEMIHNPQVNADLQSYGITFMQDTYGKQLIPFESLTADDIVVIPAFGTTLEIEEKLRKIGIQIEKYNTTCPFVEKVWNRSEQIARKDYTIVIHGKPRHEETRATFSHASFYAASIVVKDMNQAIELGKYISGDIRDLQKIGVVNQTTMLASDTQAIADHLKQVMIATYQPAPDQISARFADTRDTLCYATNDNQSAVYGMLETKADLAIVVGGYNSSNTSHLVELCEEKLPTYFIRDESKLLSKEEIEHFDFHHKLEKNTKHYLPEKTPVDILITSGASCPDAIVERVIKRLKSFFEG